MCRPQQRSSRSSIRLRSQAAIGPLRHPRYADVCPASGTYTNVYGELIQIAIGGAGTVTNATGLQVNTPTGATNNYTAIFGTGTGTVVGFGTASPSTANIVTINSTYSGATVTQTTALAINTQFNYSVNATALAGLKSTIRSRRPAARPGSRCRTHMESSSTPASRRVNRLRDRRRRLPMRMAR